jgi:hypothetical protein
MSNDIFMVGDKVFYVGERHKQELTREGKSLAGWIHATVDGRPGVYITWWPETKQDDSYVMSHHVLTKARPAPDKKQQQHDGPEIMPRRKKKEDV